MYRFFEAASHKVIEDSVNVGDSRQVGLGEKVNHVRQGLGVRAVHVVEAGSVDQGD
jgi:hypothetical protein